MKFLSSALYACVVATYVVATPVKLDYSERAQEDAKLVIRGLEADPASFAKTKFTHLVVGGGTAGVAVAVRLSEEPSYTVGIIEAGPVPFGDPKNSIPGMFGANLGTQYDWSYKTEPSPSGAPSIGWPRGKVLGGSSVLNFLVWDRAAKVEYDAWEELGSSGWNWGNLYKYMKKAEDFTAPSENDARQLGIDPVVSNYGSSGAVQISYPRYISQQAKKWIPALQSLGVPRNTQPLAGNNLGASQHPSDINPVNSTRSSSADAYFAPASGRKNLKVLVSALATKIEMKKSGDGYTATGVTYTKDGQSYTAKADKIVVSGGSVNTPALLELSGIGSRDVLSKAGIQVKVENPNVGENLQEHTYTAAAYRLVSGQITLDSLRNDPSFAADQQARYQANQVSILDETVPSIGYLTLKEVVGSSKAKSMIKDAAAYVQTQKDKPYYKTLQKQIEFLQKNGDKVGQMEVIGIDGYFAGSAPPAAGANYVTFLAAQQHLLSRGSIHISSNDPSKAPTIQPNYFTAPYDLDILTAGTEYLRKIAGSSSYADNFIESEAVPGNVDIRNYVLKTFTTEYHPVGTASMLPREEGGVVDANLKVYGTLNVYVADASIIPSHITAHIQATVYGIAEAAADILKGNRLSCDD